ncbi:MAG: RluA family pseudouridine synthase, partial [Firmicutes bacterium]|nr:RluA family pseudouridine synthase [Bacillota bacterium]
MKRLEYVLSPEDEELFLGEILRRRLSFSSRMVKRVKFSGQLLLDGEPVPVRTRGRAGSVLSAVFPEEESAAGAEDIPIDVIYEDDWILAVNKPAGMVVHPTKGYTEGTLLNAVLWHAASRGESYSPHFVNRLD